MGRAAGDHYGLAVRRLAVERRVAERAIRLDAFVAEGAPGKAYRHLHAVFHNQAERGVTTRAGELIGEHIRQHLEDPERHAAVGAQSDGRVLIVLHDIGVHELGLMPEEVGVQDPSNQHQKNDQHHGSYLDDPRPVRRFHAGADIGEKLADVGGQFLLLRQGNLQENRLDHAKAAVGPEVGAERSLSARDAPRPEDGSQEPRHHQQPGVAGVPQRIARRGDVEDAESEHHHAVRPIPDRGKARSKSHPHIDEVRSE